MRFIDRRDAATRLARVLLGWGLQAVVVVGITRGGVPVASLVAGHLGAPLDLRVVRRLVVPGRPRLSLGAIAEGGGRSIDGRVLALTGTRAAELHAIELHEQQVLQERARFYRGAEPPLPLRKRVVLVVDDGSVNGPTLRAALSSIRREAPVRVIVALPVATTATLEAVRCEADAALCLASVPSGPETSYDRLPEVQETEVRALLEVARRGRAAMAPARSVLR